MPYQWILLDADNTILDFDRAEHYALEKAMVSFGLPFQKGSHPTYQRINKACWEAFENGEITRQELRLHRFERFFAEIGARADEQAFADTYLRHLGQTGFLLEGAEKLVRQLAGSYQLALVTNGLREVQRPRLAHSGLQPFFQTVIVSDEIGHSKPDAAFFEYTFEQIGQPPKKEVLIVGDSLNADIRGGAEFGIDTCWYNPGGVQNGHTVKPHYEIAHLGQLSGLL